MNNIPVFSIDLISELDRDYPEQCPDPATPEREIWMRAGERRLVRRLVALQQQQEEEGNILE